MGSPVFEVYNEDGSLQMNLASRLTKFLGALQINLSATGSHFDAELRLGTPWYFVAIPEGFSVAGFKNPIVTFNNGTMTWTADGGGNTPGWICYGVYSNGNN